MNTREKLQNILDRYTASGEELGCQLAVYQNGELLYSLCSGYADSACTKNVTENTVFPVFSVGKGITSTLFLRLLEQGKIRLDDPVVKYWPEYGCAGKEKTLVRDILTHRAGLFNIPEGISMTGSFDWESMIRGLERNAPEEVIGGIHHYHAFTFGILAGYLAELADGRPFRQLMREEVLVPVGADRLFFGVPENERHDMAEIDNRGVPNECLEAHNSMESIVGLNPSSNCRANALSLAKVYASLIGNGLHGKRLLTQETVAKATVLQRSPDDPVQEDQWDKFGLGFALCAPMPEIGRMFGHGGACGSEAFADRETGLAVGFTKNRQSPNHPNHAVRNEISKVLGIPIRVW